MRSWTTVGNVGSSHHATVDQRGLVTPWARGWSLDWWIGADDRWHFPAREVAVRQSLVELTPVVETAMRVPSGDAVQRVYATVAGDEFVVVEIENRSPVPFAVALAVCAYNPEGRARVKRVDLVDTAVTVDGRAAVVLPSHPHSVEASTLGDGDVAAAVGKGTAFLFPLAHRATMRVALPMERLRLSKAEPPRGSLPSADAVVRGWQAHTRVPRFELPPGGLADAFEANRRFLQLFGMAVGEFAADGTELDRLDGMLRSATSTYTWGPGHDRRTAAAFVAIVRSLLVHAAPGGLTLCRLLPPEWMGQNLEVHDVPTVHGTLSFAVRWHGDRPALLWELVGNDPEVVITAPGLDPTFRAADASGDALLTPDGSIPSP